MRGKSWFGLTDIFLLIIIILNILDFFEIISSELDYAKKLISWILLGYLLYKASPSKVFFGQKNSDMDTLLVFSYFLLVIKNLISYAQIAIYSSHIMKPFYSLLINNYAVYEQWTFYIGIIALILIALFVALKTPFGKRSIMGVLHEEGNPNPRRLVERFLMTLIVMFGFFLFVFNMMMEWLAIAVDATLLLIGLLCYSIFLMRHKVSMHGFLDKVGNIGSQFYKSFIDHFRYKESFLLGIVGLLVLHLLTDVGNFLIPYITGVRDQLYFGLLGPGHEHVWFILTRDLAATPLFFDKIMLIIVFLANIIGWLLLFVSPAIMWYYLYHKRRPVLPKKWLITLLVSLPAVLFAPLFTISRLNTTNLIGVDVQTQSLMQGIPAWLIVAIMACVGIMYEIWHSQKVKASLEKFWVAITIIFFSSYIYKYFIDVATYYQDVVFGFLQAKNYFLASIFFMFTVLIILFYVGGLFLFMYELGKQK